jgi:ABC-type spermidine/putrescine transport system permease subunit II
MLVDRRRARFAATLLGSLITLLVLFLYLPIFLTVWVWV